MPATLVTLVTRGALVSELQPSSIRLCVGALLSYPKDLAHSKEGKWVFFLPSHVRKNLTLSNTVHLWCALAW
jgi:hypothetical protein